MRFWGTDSLVAFFETSIMAFLFSALFLLEGRFVKNALALSFPNMSKNEQNASDKPSNLKKVQIAFLETQETNRKTMFAKEGFLPLSILQIASANTY